jgi:two-component system LytT family response regulator
MIRALIVDDEPLAREELQALIEETGACEVIASCGNAFEAIKVINSARPDLIFLDIQMPVIDGFELLGMIDQGVMPHVVFVTAYDRHALRAFEERTLDYLLKPVDKDRLAKTFSKLKGVLLSNHNTLKDFIAQEITRIPCSFGNRIKLVSTSDIDHVRSDLGGVNIITRFGEFHTELTLKALEEHSCLVRCHRQFMVNIDHIEELYTQDNGAGEIATRNEHTIPVSRRLMKRIRELFSPRR